MTVARQSGSVRSSGDAGYRHARYAEALAEFGTPVFLPRCGGWVLRRPVPHSSFSDATGCYPMFSCDRWDHVHEDLPELARDLVSVTIVTDPFADVTLDYLRRAFETVLPFKQHFVVNLKDRESRPLGRHHRRYAARASRDLTIERCETPLDFLDEWLTLYDGLVRKHRLRGVRAFSRQSFARQFDVPGLVMFRASRSDNTVGLHLWFEQGDIAYAHLGATSDEGRALMASYGLYAAALEWFTSRVTWLSLGGAAGTRDTPRDGLGDFKRGWATETRPVYVCGRILNPSAYASLSRDSVDDGNYFPVYRRGEFE